VHTARNQQHRYGKPSSDYGEDCKEYWWQQQQGIAHKREPLERRVGMGEEERGGISSSDRGSAIAKEEKQKLQQRE
jgi:hypothetical protein